MTTHNQPTPEAALREKLSNLPLYVPSDMQVFPEPLRLGTFLTDKDMDAILQLIQPYTSQAGKALDNYVSWIERNHCGSNEKDRWEQAASEIVLEGRKRLATMDKGVEE